MKKTQTWVLVSLICVILLLLFSPYIKAEYLTHKHGEQFQGLESQTKMLKDSRYFKVLEYTDQYAKVFYVSNTGDLITFVKNNGSWELSTWETVWSTSGSADGFMWPYYR